MGGETLNIEHVLSSMKKLPEHMMIKFISLFSPSYNIS